MASVSPSSSASQVKAPMDVSWLSPADLCALLDKAKETGVADVEGFVNRYMAYSSAYLRVLEKGYDSASNVSYGSRSAVSRSSRLSRTSAGSWRSGSRSFRDLDWRASSKSVLRTRPTTGRCFEKLLSVGAGVGIGDNPTFFELLAMPAAHFVPDAQLQRLRMDRQDAGVVHVGDEGAHSAYQVLAVVAGASAMPYTGPTSMWSKMRSVQVAGVSGYLPTDLVGMDSRDVTCMEKIFREDVTALRLVQPDHGIDMVERSVTRTSLWSMDLLVFGTRLCDVVAISHKSSLLGFLPVVKGCSDSDLMRRVFNEFSSSLGTVRWLAGGNVPIGDEHYGRAYRVISGKRCFMLRDVAPGSGLVRGYSELLAATVPGYLYQGVLQNLHVARPVASLSERPGPWIPDMPGVAVGAVDWVFGKEMEDDGVEILVSSGVPGCAAGPVRKVLDGSVYYIDLSRGGYASSDYQAFRRRASQWRRVEGFDIPLELYLGEEDQIVAVIAGDIRP